MPTPHDPDTDELLDHAAVGDAEAVEQLLVRYRKRLHKMVTIRLDPRLAGRFDPSDVVQDALAEAHRRLSEYTRDRRVAFYPWLREIAWNRLVDLHRQHVKASRRAVDREEPFQFSLSDRSALALAGRLIHSGSSPSRRLLHKELRLRVREAIEQLPTHYREVLVMRHLEQLSVSEIAAVLHTAEGTVKSRHFRALEQLRGLLAGELEEDEQ